MKGSYNIPLVPSTTRVDKWYLMWTHCNIETKSRCVLTKHIGKLKKSWKLIMSIKCMRFGVLVCVVQGEFLLRFWYLQRTNVYETYLY